jgi:hypothetical protein
MNRTTFLVDGFNVYHSAKAAAFDMRGASTKWLDFRSLLSSYLPVIGGGARCHTCKRDTPHFEEKETDVAISMKLVEIFHGDEADTVVLVTGDTDLAPAVQTTMRLFPTKQICFGFPYKRKNKELTQLVTAHFYIRKERYAAHQLPDPVVLPSGRRVPKPAGW